MDTMVFISTSLYEGAPGYKEKSGQVVEILGPLPETDYDREDVGNMFRVRFADGTEADVFEDELVG